MKKLLFLLTLVSFYGCSYKFNGASISQDMKTVNVQFFENNAPLIVPDLSNKFTEELKNRIRNQTKLKITTGDANAVFEGRITGYSINPIAIQDNARPTAGANRLSITVSVKFTNLLEPARSFEQSFERFKNFTLNGQTLQAIEPQLIKEINGLIAEDIFNRAFAQW